MPTGKQSWRFALLALAAMFLIIGVWLIFGYNREPRYEGHPVSYWFRESYRHDANGDTRHTEREITNALIHLGTKALPYLVGQALNTRQETALRTNFFEFLDKLPDSWHLPTPIGYDDIRDSAVRAISLIGPKVEDLLPLVRDAADSTNALLHRQALEIIYRNLNGSEDGLVPIFARALHYEDAESVAMSLSYLEACENLTNAVVPDLIQLLKDNTKLGDFHKQAASLLGDIGPGAAPAVPRLKELFENETNWPFRAVLARSLYQIDTNQTAALAFLTTGLRQEGSPEDTTGSSPPPPVNPSGWFPGRGDVSVSYAFIAAATLYSIGTNAQSAIPALLEALKNVQPSDLSQITDALEAVGAQVDAFLPILLERLKSNDDSMRFFAAEQVLDVDKTNAEAISVLIGLVQSHSEHETRAIFVLGNAGSAASSAIPAVIEALNGTNLESWIAAPQVLVELGAPPSSFLPKLEQLLGSTDDNTFKNTNARLELVRKILEVDPANREAQLVVVRMLKGELPAYGMGTDVGLDLISIAERANPPIKEVIPALQTARLDAAKQKDRDHADALAEAIEQIEANEKKK